MEHKRCGKCKEIKSTRAFARNKSRKAGIHNECKECQATYNRIWFARKNYGISDAHARRIVDLIRSGEAFCEICGENLILSKTGYSIDHCHMTNKVRGLLCRNCNNGLGHFKDDLYSLEKAQQYLRKYGNT